MKTIIITLSLLLGFTQSAMAESADSRQEVCGVYLDNLVGGFHGLLGVSDSIMVDAPKLKFSDNTSANLHCVCLEGIIQDNVISSLVSVTRNTDTNFCNAVLNANHSTINREM